MKKFIKEYFTFTRKERIAVFSLLTILTLIFFYPSIYSLIKPSPKLEIDSSWSIAMKNLVEEQKPGAKNDEDPNQNPTTESFVFDKTVPYNPKELFYFDPNTATKEEWLRLGLREKTIGTIQNYLSKGGKFRQASDLKKIYGLHENDYARLLPFIKITNSTESLKTGDEKPVNEEITNTNRPNVGFEIRDINAADTSDFIKLPGIGSKLALRIVNFRDKLGGFYSIEQLKETYGIADSVFQKIKSKLRLGSTAIKTININTANIDELKAHPYLRYEISKAIIAYRKEHGDFKKKEDIRNVMAVTNEVYSKVSPYLMIQ